ncbi:MAG: Rieske (2Fe-2S) protein [Pseudomonadota bacterium]
MSNFQIVASVKEMPIGTSKLVQVEGKIISVFHTEEGWFALDERCSHRGGPLSEGTVEKGCVICPWHQARFDLKSGQCMSNSKLSPVRTYPVQVDEDKVLVLLE